MQAEELKNLFLAEALVQQSELEQLLLSLEKKPEEAATIESLFRITHTLKANAAAMGLEAITQIAHGLEDIFAVLKHNTHKVDSQLCSDLLKANDKLLELLRHKDSSKTIAYKGLLTRLRVILRTLQENNQSSSLKENSKLPNNTLPHEAKENQSEISNTIAIPIQKLDNLLNLVGELSIERDRMMTAIPKKQKIKKNDFSHLYRITTDLQHSVLETRLVQIGLLFQKLPRVVRDIEQLESKSITLSLEGKQTEIDRNMLQIIFDSVMHLIRNAASHGIESLKERKVKGKKPEGQLSVRASNEQDQVILEVQDDGKGIDAQFIRQKAIEKGLLTEETARKVSDEHIIELIFETGFSSARSVSEVSGRGVGLDVVKKTVASVGGKVSLETKIGKGTTFRLSLPTSMVIKPALLFEVNRQTFAITLSYTEAVKAVVRADIFPTAKGLTTTYHDEVIPVVFLKDIFDYLDLNTPQVNAWKREHLNLRKTYNTLETKHKCSFIIVSEGTRRFALVVDKILNQKEIIEKKLKPPLNNLLLFSNATILGNGNVALVLNVPALINFLFKNLQILR